MVRLLSYDEFERSVKALLKSRDKGYWSNFQDRWNYHQRAIEILGTLELKDASEVLEIGTMGVQLVPGSDTMDLRQEHWVSSLNEAKEVPRPTYERDARDLPWPIEAKKYRVLVGLRVFHHLYPVQKECFEEARRVADNVLLVVPKDSRRIFCGDYVGIAPEQFVEWNDGERPTIMEKLPTGGYLYFWST